MGKYTKAILSATDFLKSFSDKIFYHSTTQDIKQFEPEIGIEKGLYPEEKIAQDRGTRGATYVSSDVDFINKNIAEGWQPIDEYGKVHTVYPFGTNIMPLRIKDKNLFDYKNTDHLAILENAITEKLGINQATNFFEKTDVGSGNWEVLETPFIQTLLKKSGFRGYKTNEPETVGMFYPEDIRSVFAKFDPARSRSDDILASGLAGATGYGALQELENE
jgi:hypothetical protein